MASNIIMVILFFWFEFGITPYVSYNIGNYIYNNSFEEFNVYTNMNIDIRYNILFVKSNIKTYFTKMKKDISFRPENINYIINIGIIISKNVKIGFRHSCYHPIMPYRNLYYTKKILEGGYQEIYIKIGGKIK